MAFVRFIPALLAAACAALSATRATADELVREQRQVSGFSRVVLPPVGDLIVTQAEHESLVIEAETKLLPKITAEVRNGVLYLGFNEPQISTQYPIRFHLAVKTLSALESRGSGTISAGPLATDMFDVMLGGSGNARFDALTVRDLRVRLTGASGVQINGGNAQAQTVSISGSGTYAAGRFASRHAAIGIEGSGSAEVWVKESLSARITGAGDIRYHGNPQVQEMVTGAGRVSRASANVERN